MATIKIPRKYDSSKVLLADDEPEHLDWLIDYLKSKGCQVVVATNVRTTIEIIEGTMFRAYLIDLNIPFGGWNPIVSGSGAAYGDYHGLYILKLVRTQGNPGSRVVAYSAHQNEQIVGAIKRLYCQYVLKGRPRELKQAVDAILSRPPRPPNPPRKKRVPAKTVRVSPVRARRQKQWKRPTQYIKRARRKALS